MSLVDFLTVEEPSARPSRYPPAVPGIDFPSASDDVRPGIPRPPDAPEDLAALRRVSDGAIGDELLRRRALRERG